MISHECDILQKKEAVMHSLFHKINSISDGDDHLARERGHDQAPQE